MSTGNSKGGSKSNSKGKAKTEPKGKSKSKSKGSEMPDNDRVLLVRKKGHFARDSWVTSQP